MKKKIVIILALIGAVVLFFTLDEVYRAAVDGWQLATFIWYGVSH